jgi:hypothetical protein
VAIQQSNFGKSLSLRQTATAKRRRRGAVATSSHRAARKERLSLKNSFIRDTRVSVLAGRLNLRFEIAGLNMLITLPLCGVPRS